MQIQVVCHPPSRETHGVKTDDGADDSTTRVVTFDPLVTTELAAADANAAKNDAVENYSDLELRLWEALQLQPFINLPNAPHPTTRAPLKNGKAGRKIDKNKMKS